MLATAADRKDPGPGHDALQLAAAVPGAPEAAVLFANATRVFLTGYSERGSVHAGCVEATGYFSKPPVPERIEEYFAYGYEAARRSFRDLCPL